MSPGFLLQDVHRSNWDNPCEPYSAFFHFI
jgi:hypothetical protein